MSMDYTAIDLETANGKRGSICQLGLTRIRDGRITNTVNMLLKPPLELGAFSPVHTRIHGINWRDVASKPNYGQIHDSLIEFVGDDRLVAHNAVFERSALRQIIEHYALRQPDWRFLCTIDLSKVVLPGLERYKLPVVLDALGMAPSKHHDALADSIDAARILAALADKTGATSVPDLLARTGVRTRSLT